MTNIFELSPEEAVQALASEYIVPLPDGFESSEDYMRVGHILSLSANAYAYLSVLLVTAKARVRNARKTGIKEEIDLAVDRKDAVTAVLDAVKMQYNAASRLISWKEKAEEEYGMVKYQ